MEPILPYRYKNTEKFQDSSRPGGRREPVRLILAALVAVSWAFMGDLVCFMGKQKLAVERR